MKHTTTRKKMLLSSVAMLLVAMMALSSATFAWFVQNTTVKAEGFSAKAASSVGIKILSESDATKNSTTKSIDNKSSYGYTTTLYTGQANAKVLSPVSLNTNSDTMAMYSTIADAADSYEAASTATDVSTADASSYYKENVYVVLDGDNDDTTNVEKEIKVTSMTVSTVESADMAAGIRVALYYTTGGATKFVGAYAPDKKENEKVYAGEGKIGTAATGKYTFNTFASVNNAPVPGTTEGSKATVNETAGANYFTVVVYLDGEDSTVRSNNIPASNLVSNVSLTFGV